MPPARPLSLSPNCCADYNQRYETLSASEFRHADHRFEWCRAGFARWATAVASLYGYQVRLVATGEEVEGRRRWRYLC